MEFVILGLLILKNQTVYELNKAFQQGVALFYSASYGSLQTALKKLVQQGDIYFEEHVDRGRNKKIYVISDKGKEAFYVWMGSEISTSRLESTALAKVFFLGLVESVADRRAILIQIITQIEKVETELQHMDEGLQNIQVPAPYAEILTYQIKTLDYGIRSHSFAKEWFKTLLAELPSDTL
ncbi:helix-turn-helix transcriptional regulator [Paenibacillus qinlingensis]|uniref:DNA-binding PadR family transcriptional regulator n=1 Tax=Paenibacillus qinlingensis TaxID=1837343 RepID=A0ABU1NMZ0_9BACL|nr:helix-turn-helix transcriptional regulator [Paenibacillus qinlingensis]MDR6548834.1 DNA-binding PadR family transcriptional regulator [Paenibacillus qinlingensis]